MPFVASTAENSLPTQLAQFSRFSFRALSRCGILLGTPEHNVWMSRKNESVHLDDYAGKNVVLIFYQGGECLHCMEQMQKANKLVNAFEKLDTITVAISKDDCETIQSYEGEIDVTLLSDPDFAISKAYRSFDDFEEIELHSTVLIDKLGRVHWSQNGGEPFMDFDFLESEIKRLNGLQGEAKK